jgi:hypothetical protein
VFSQIIALVALADDKKTKIAFARGEKTLFKFGE